MAEEMLKQISCSPECGFMVRSHNEQEVVSMGMEHVTKQHPDLNTTPEEMKAKMTDAPEM